MSFTFAYSAAIFICMKKGFFKEVLSGKHPRVLGAKELLKYIGPGLLVTVGFIDPGNWASNIAAGSEFGYELLWVVTLSTIMLIILQHNAAHLGIATGLCISEAATKHFRKWVSRTVLATSILACVSTALAEILGAAIGLKMLFGIPLVIGSALTCVLVVAMILTNSYRKIERWIIGFVSIIGVSFIYELFLADVSWLSSAKGWVTPSLPSGSIIIVMSVLGAVVMPHNLFLHSEVIQSRQWNLEDEKTINKQLKYEFTDTLTAMLIGWAINSAMVILAAAVFFKGGIEVTELEQAADTLRPLIGNSASVVFAVALICAGIASSLTACIAGGSIFAGIFGEPFNVKDVHSKLGIAITAVFGTIVIFFLNDPFQGLIYSQTALSIQLPITIFTLIALTSSKKVMGSHANGLISNALNWTIAIIVSALNLILFYRMI